MRRAEGALIARSEGALIARSEGALIARSEGALIARRALLGTALSLPWMGGARAAAASTPTLKSIAASRGLLFGSELESVEIEDAAYRRFFANECAVLVPGREAKFDATEPQPGVFDFVHLDRIVDYATANHIALRLHTIVWGLAEPSWLRPALDDTDRNGAAAILGRHISTVMGRYRGRVLAWDVANEVSDPLWNRGPEGLTLTPWRKALGPDLIPLAFTLARAADPQAKLFLNEDGLEYRGRRFDEKRATYLRMLAGWKRAGVPIDGFGIQAHLDPTLPLDMEGYRNFLRELAGMGLELHITEFDVRDRTLPAPLAARDAAIASLAGRVLETALDERAVTAVLCWGLTTRRSYQNTDREFARADGLPTRGLPFDAALQPTPLYRAIAAALAAAPIRGEAAPLRGEAG